MMFAATSFPKPLPIIKPSSPLQSSRQWNPTFSSFSMQLPSLSLTENRLKLVRNSNLYQKHSTYTLKSVSNPRTCTTTLDFEDECRSRSGLMDEILKLLKTLQVPATVAIILGLLFMCNPQAALSATGGRMGGGSFSSSSNSSSRSSSDSSYSSSSSPSYSSSSSSSSPSYWDSPSYSSSSSSGSRSSSSSSGSRSSSSSPSRSSSSSSSSRSSSGSSYSSSSSPSYSSSSSSPSYSYSSPSKSKSSVKSSSYSSTSPNSSSSEESPSYWSSSSVVKPSSSSTSPRTSSSATSASKSKSSSSASESDSSMKGILFICFCASIAYIWITTLLSPKTSVIKIQVCLLGTAKLLQKDLDAVAGVADTSTAKGWSYILKESALALLRYPHYCISAHSIVYLETKNTECMTNIETLFNRLSIEEREKFDEETLVNVNNIKRKGTMRKPKSGISNEYIVVTILVAAHGKYKFPRVIKTRENLKEALQIFGSIPTEETLAVEVLWTPQDENDALSEQELHENYPLLIVLPQ